MFNSYLKLFSFLLRFALGYSREEEEVRVEVDSALYVAAAALLLEELLRFLARKLSNLRICNEDLAFSR